MDKTFVKLVRGVQMDYIHDGIILLTYNQCINVPEIFQMEPLDIEESRFKRLSVTSRCEQLYNCITNVHLENNLRLTFTQMELLSKCKAVPLIKICFNLYS